MNPLDEIDSLAADMKAARDFQPKLILSRDGTMSRPVPGQSDKPSKYELSPMSGSTIEQDYLNDEDAFHNPRLPEVGIQCEKPEHRIIIFLKAQGYSHLEIAEKTGYSAVHVGTILRQPWAAKRLMEEIQKAGRDEVAILLKGHAKSAVQVLINEMDNSNARPGERITAADKLLDRLYGKPNTPITHKHVEVSAEMTDDQLLLIASGQVDSLANLS